jgi:hypothetical protein
MRISPLPRAGRLHEVDLAAHIASARATRRAEVHDRGGEHDVLHGAAECSDNAHGQHEQREGHDGVGDVADDSRSSRRRTGGDAASSPMRKTSATDATAMKKSSRVATTTGLNTSRPSWSVPNQCASDGPLSAATVCWRGSGRDRTDQRGQHNQQEQRRQSR